MEKTCCEFKVVETDKGYRVEAKGDTEALKEAVGGCCGGTDAPALSCCDVKVTCTEDGCECTIEGDKEVIKEAVKTQLSSCCGKK